MKPNPNPEDVVMLAVADLFGRDAKELSATHPELAAQLELQASELHARAISDERRKRLSATREINLGCIHLASYKPTTNLFGDCTFEDEDDEFKQELARQIERDKPDEIILGPNTKWQLVIDYPLTDACAFQIIAGENGITRRGIVNFIVKTYKQIYAEEKKSSTLKAKTLPRSFNRNRTDGKHGIWGHVLGDLILHTLYVGTDGRNLLTVGVDS